MPNRKKIFAISGSTRADSVNLHILQAIADMYTEKVDFVMYDGIDLLPHFNPDLDKEPFPTEVVHFRRQIEEANGVLICTPEYVFSLPGSLKNAMEWTVSTTLFTHKPVALITAASSGLKAHDALNLLMSTLTVVPVMHSLLITAPKTKISEKGKITDEKTLQEIQHMMQSFIRSLSPA